MTNPSFFDETTEQSQVKAVIVSKYFWAWASVMIPIVRKRGGKIGYIDLFAGPGRYADGTPSTPLLVLERVTQVPELRDMLATTFNDKDKGHAKALEAAIASLPGIKSLRYPPVVMNTVVGEDLATTLEQSRLIPTLFFVDPWGYKGLSLRLINAVVKNWGCDCVFFFNYNRINPGLTNPAVKAHMDALFGQPHAEHLRERLSEMTPHERELAIIEDLCQALKGDDGRYVLPFCFKNERGSRSSHHLVFVTKHFKGYEIMKQIMAKESSRKEQGVASLSYCPADTRQPTLFEMARPLDHLQDMLVAHFRGRKLLMREVYAQHNVGTPFIEKNYKDALIALEAAGRITAEPPMSKRRKGTFGPNVTVTF